MTSELTIFNFGASEVRSMTDEQGAPWFVASDVCRCLDLSNTSSTVSRLDDDEKGYKDVDTLGGSQRLLIVNEQGIYQLVFASRSEKVRPFKRWLSHEVIPSLRKTGNYSVALPKTFSEALRALAAEVEAKELLQIENAEMQPKADFYDAVVESEDTVDMAATAKLIKVGMGRNTLMAELRSRAILKKDNTPYQEFIDRGYFALVETKWQKPDGSQHITLKTVVYQRGVEFIRRKLSPCA